MEKESSSYASTKFATRMDLLVDDSGDIHRPIEKFRCSNHGVVLSVPHVQSLSKISMESGKVIGSQRYSFHEGK